MKPLMKLPASEFSYGDWYGACCPHHTLSRRSDICEIFSAKTLEGFAPDGELAIQLRKCTEMVMEG